MHKNTKITSACRREIYELWKQGRKITVLAQEFRVTRPVIYKILKRGVWNDFSVHKSINKRYKKVSCGPR